MRSITAFAIVMASPSPGSIAAIGKDHGEQIIRQVICGQPRIAIQEPIIKSALKPVDVDGITVDEMLPYLKEHREELLSELQSGRYKPKAVRRVDILNPTEKRESLEYQQP